MTGCVDRKNFTFSFTIQKLCGYCSVDSIPRFHARKLFIIPTFRIYAFVVILTIILSNGNVLCFSPR
jgi:hypothetical protein